MARGSQTLCVALLTCCEATAAGAGDCMFNLALKVSDIYGVKSSDYREGGMTCSCPTVTP